MIRLPFCLLKTGLLFEPRFLLVWWAGLLNVSWAFSWFLCATKICSLVRRERRVPPLDQQVCWHLGMPSSSVTRRQKHHFWIPDKPPEMLGESRTQTQDTKAFQEAIFISVPALAQQIHIQRLSPKNKGVSPYIPLQVGYRSKNQGLTNIWLNATLLATLRPVLCDLLQV
jgi:hypothetical protein